MQMSDFTQVLSLQNNRLFSVKTPLSGRSQLAVSNFSYPEEPPSLAHVSNDGALSIRFQDEARVQMPDGPNRCMQSIFNLALWATLEPLLPERPCLPRRGRLRADCCGVVDFANRQPRFSPVQLQSLNKM
jgi:hypothetical protein